VRDFSLAKAGFTEKPAIEMAGRRTDLKNGACIGVLGSNRISMGCSTTSFADFLLMTSSSSNFFSLA
jgi:hypothetical protein